MSEYWSAQICLNGHIINRTVEAVPEAKFCETCGEKTIISCPNCQAQLRGLYRGGFNLSPVYNRPKFCFSCGQSYPWTDRQSQAAKELVDFTDNLSNEEKEDLKQSIDSIISDNANSTVAQMKYKKYAIKAGAEVAKGMRDILIDVVSETVKKAIWGQ